MNSNNQTTIQFNKNILTLGGDLVFKTVMPVLAESLHYLSAGTDIIVDFEKVNHCDSAALALICEWLRVAKQRKANLQFSHMPLQLQKLIKVSGIEGLLGSHPAA